MEKRHLYLYFKYLVDNKKRLSTLNHFQTNIMFNLISMLDDNFCSPAMNFKSFAVSLLACEMNIYRKTVLTLLKEISETGFLIRCYKEYGYYYTFSIRKISTYYHDLFVEDENFRKIIFNIDFIHDFFL